MVWISGYVGSISFSDRKNPNETKCISKSQMREKLLSAQLSRRQHTSWVQVLPRFSSKLLATVVFTHSDPSMQSREITHKYFCLEGRKTTVTDSFVNNFFKFTTHILNTLDNKPSTCCLTSTLLFPTAPHCFLFSRSVLFLFYSYLLFVYSECITIHITITVLL